MSAEREIVDSWLNSRGYFTVSDINAGSRIVDFVAVRYKGGSPEVIHVEVACSVSASALFERERNEIRKLFYDPHIVGSVESCIVDFFGTPVPYRNLLVTNFSNIAIDGVEVVRFEDVLFEFMSGLDKQRYHSQTIRALQLLKFLLMSDPARMSALLSRQSVHKPMTASAKEELIKELLSQDVGKRVFRKQSNEQLLLDILRASSLKSPERLANALEEILSKRTGSRFLNLLMQKKGVRAAIKEELSRDMKLEHYFKR